MIGVRKQSQRWAPQRPEYYVQTGSMFENPFGVPHDEIARYILENEPEVVAQVVFGKYVDASGLVFTAPLIEQLFDQSLPVIRTSRYRDKVVAEQVAKQDDDWLSDRFCTGVDLARQTDWTVITTLDLAFRPARVVYWSRLNRVPWDSIYAEVGRVRSMFGPRILFDSTGATGDTAGEAFQTKMYCRVHHKVNPIGQPCYAGSRRLEGCKVGEHLSLARCDGYTFTEGSKRTLVEHLRNVLGHGYNARIPNAPFGLVRAPRIPVLRDELTFYTWMDKKLQTDALFSLALACWEGLWDELGEASFGSVHGE